MKKFISIAVVCTILSTACSSPLKPSSSRKNNLNASFTSDAVITLDRLTAECTVKRIGDGEWETEFSSPNTLSGVNLKFSEGNVEATYKGLSFSVPKSALPVKAMLVNLIDAVDKNARAEELNGTENDGMLEISGTLDSGDYVITADKDGNLSAFEMPANNLKMEFSGLSVNSPTDIVQNQIQESTENVTAETVPPETDPA